MKIKKTFQGELPENRIVNAKSNSQTDAYSANYLNDKLNKVAVSLEEPTTGEEVWIKRSINTLKFSDFTKEVNGITFKMKDQVLSIKGTATAYIQDCYMPIKKTLEEDMTLTQYTSGEADGLVVKATYTDNGTSYYPNLLSAELNKGAYIDQLYFVISSGAVIDAEVRFQLERGKGTHDWQPVTEKQVFVKNENGVYEELVKKNLHIGADEPKNGEDVWIQKGKNLFNINAIPTVNFYSYATADGNTLTVSGSSENFVTYLIDVLPKTDYTVSISDKTGNGIAIYDANVDNYIAGMSSVKNLTFNSGNRTQISLVVYGGGSYENIQLEQGTAPTPYEEYIIKKIYVKDERNDEYIKVCEGYELKDTGWVNVNGYVNYRIVNGIAYVRGSSSSKEIGDGNYTVVATLPMCARPNTMTMFTWTGVGANVQYQSGRVLNTGEIGLYLPNGQKTASWGFMLSYPVG